MHREESEQLTPCAACGAMIWPSTDRGYTFGSQQALCWDCAIRRGGTYDADKDRWTVDPNVGDLMETDPRAR